MNEIIKRELQKIHQPLPDYNDNTTHIIIPQKIVDTAPKFETGKSYIVKLADYILNEPPNFTLSSNWNKGIIPQSQTLIIYVKELVGKMVRVCGRGIDIGLNIYLNDIYDDLWLPDSGVEVLYLA